MEDPADGPVEMKGKVNRVEAQQSEGGLGLWRNSAMILHSLSERSVDPAHRGCGELHLDIWFDIRRRITYCLDSLVCCVKDKEIFKMAQWQLQEAKNKFSEVIDKAIKDGPQVVTRRGIETVVVVSVDEYRNLTKPQTDIVDFFQKSPLKDANLDLARNRDLPRKVDI